MNKLDLIAKLADLEWEDFEVKEAKANVPKDSWETVSSFSNTSGGWLVFGVKQIGKSFEIQGIVNPEKIEQDFLNGLRGDRFNVQISTRQEKYNIDDKVLMAFFVPASNKKPVYFNSPRNTFIRRGSADHRATKEEVDSMYRDQTFGTKTSELAPGTTKGDLNTTSLNRYRDYMSRFNRGVSYNRFNDDEFLSKLRIVEDGQCTYGGLLMFGKREIIEKHVPDFWIDLLEVPGISYSDAKTRYTFRLDEYENLWEYYFECFARLKQKVDVTFVLTAEGFGQELSPGLVAIREALVNMLMHADYFSPAHSRIRTFTDHIEFYNPGGLPKPLEELKGKDISLPRNPIITKLFRMVKLAENAGFGFDKIETNWMDYNKTKPIYDLSFDSTIIKFQLEVSEGIRKEFGKNSERIQDEFGKDVLYTFQLIVENKYIKTAEIAAQVGKSTRTIEKYIDKLKNAGIILRKGPKLGGYWDINDD
jgi:ATP-dependent DNA helicase RecG